MSIKGECFNTAKKIWELELTSQVRKLLTDLNSTSEDKSNTLGDRSHLGYIARRQRAQFMGYLIVDYKRDYINEKSGDNIPNISDKEREILKRANFILSYINKKSVENITDAIPNLTSTLSIYSNFEYPDYEYKIEELINVSDFLPLIESIKECEITKNILNSPREFACSIPSDSYLGASMEFNTRLQRKGVHEVPQDFVDLNFDKNSPEFIARNLILSAMCLRQTLKNVATLLFQAFQIDRLPMLNENNIINIENYNSNLVGKGLTIAIQPNGVEILTDVEDLILYKFKFHQEQEEGICLVEGLSTSFSQDYGWVQKYKLRVLNDNLNPYFNLI